MTSGKLFVAAVVGACLTATTVTGTTLAHWQRSISVPGVAVTADVMHAPALACEDRGVLANVAYLTWTAPTEGAAPASYLVFRLEEPIARLSSTTTEFEVQDGGSYRVESSLAPPSAPLDAAAWMSSDSQVQPVNDLMLGGTVCAS